MAKSKYLNAKKGKVHTAIAVFLALLLVFSIVYFLWSLMQYNEAMDEKAENEEYIADKRDNIQRLEYLVEAPLDDEFKIRIAREKLGMCFPDEMIFYTDVE